MLASRSEGAWRVNKYFALYVSIRDSAPYPPHPTPLPGVLVLHSSHGSISSKFLYFFLFHPPKPGDLAADGSQIFLLISHLLSTLFSFAVLPAPHHHWQVLGDAVSPIGAMHSECRVRLLGYACKREVGR